MNAKVYILSLLSLVGGRAAADAGAESPMERSVQCVESLAQRVECSAQALSAVAEEGVPAADTVVALGVEGAAFFHDNEYDSRMAKGYTLPGVRLNPYVRYRPTSGVEFAVGGYALFYQGAGKYPNYAFHDVARWKGQQYSRGAHLLPFFRATIERGSTQVVLGNIYGGAAHQLSRPMYNPETTLSTDPEAGVQVRSAAGRFAWDAWVDWQSYIYETDTHQEVFTVGLTQRVRLTSRARRGFRLSLPFELLVQHRGGEQDLPELDLGVQTLGNVALGLDAVWMPSHGVWERIAVESRVLLSHQMDGRLWPDEDGKALWGSVSARLRSRWGFTLGVFHGEGFCALYGNPFFSSLSQKEPGTQFPTMTTAFWRVEHRWNAHPRFPLTFYAEGHIVAGTDAVPVDYRRNNYMDTKPVFSFGVQLRFSDLWRL